MLKLVIIGDPDWIDQLQLPPDIILQRYLTHERYLFRLADDRPHLIIVDGTAADWLRWCTTPKTSPATRRIPLVVITDDPEVQAQALRSGADQVIDSHTITTRFTQVIATAARTADPKRDTELDCACQESLPELAVEGVRKFNNREFYAQHDLFEELWVNTSGAVRDLYRAVLQVGVAYYQIERGNHRGALKMLLRAVQWLEALPDVCQTINVKQLRQDAYTVRATLEAHPPDQMANFDLALLKPLQLIGDEDNR